MTGSFLGFQVLECPDKVLLRAKMILKLASLLTESGQYARPAPRCHHMGWDLTVAGVLAYLHLHILLLPWVAK